MAECPKPSRGLQKRKCPYCGEVIEFYVMSTWHSHLEWCKQKVKAS